MINKVINSLLHSGTSYVTLSSKKRNIWLTNVASFFISGFYIIILLNRAFLGRLTPLHALLLLIEAVIIFIPILLNKLRYYNTSRIIICWFPITSLFYNAIVNFSNAVPESSTYVGFRLFIIAFACTPFLVFNTSERINLAVGLTLPVLCLAFYDPIFNFFGYGYAQVGLHEASYSYNNFRTFVSYSILALSFYFLKQALEKREEINEQLLVELEEKNKTIQQQADKNVMQLNEQLQENLEKLKASNYQLTERIKERTALYRVGQVLQNKARPVDEVLQELVTILPPGWQYPEITAARIVINGAEYKTSNYEKGVSCQSADFNLPQGSKGMIEVVYLKETPAEAEGAFMAEERNLINLIAELLRSYFVSRFESEALRKSEANLNATINNTSVLIWSLDRNLNLMAYNRSFIKYIKEHYNLEPVIGSQMLKGANGESLDMLDHNWKNQCHKVLEGETILFEENRFGIDFHCSLSPIIEDDGRITGISIFADDITEDKLRAKELGEALRKIGELRLMALRSVMNPHFIFNVLNSIQFYIVGNDRLNAVNYLSTFSKLIRSILTHSVDNKIRLEDEITMLKHYVQLEMVRFEGKFDFNLEVDPDLETDSIEIPSLLIQPYVENAILHGLYNKEEKGLLTIRIREEDDSVVFEIEDDGVGREAAMKIRKQSLADHKSLGVKLTEERLKLINEHHNVSSQVIDLMKDDKPCGTKVIIWVKIN